MKHLKVDCERLNTLKEEKFLTKRVFPQLSENMHYELLKYISPRDLLSIRGTKLGGYQLTSNILLRSRIKNYFHTIQYYPHDNIDMELIIRRYKLIFEQTGKEKLDFGDMGLGNKGVIKLTNILSAIPQTTKINLSIYIYIYIIR